MKKAMILALAVFPLLVFGQGQTGDNAGVQVPKPQPVLVSFKARGTDVRSVIADIFTQSKQNYVLQPGITFVLYMNLDKVDFEEALNIVCTQAQLQFQVQNGIYFITKKVIVAPAIPIAHRTLDPSVLTKKITVKLAKTDIRLVFDAMARQADIKIEVDKSVPNYKLDASLNHSTIRNALDKVTEATGLKYRFTDHLSILIFKPDDGSKIAVSGG
ncbi:MAG: hypothetical protein ACHQ50_10410 [Fimbriimonadales bacterium]